MKKVIPKSKPLSVSNPPGAPEVRCAFSRMISVTDLKPNPRNPNQHPPEQLAIYWKVVNHQGIRRAIVISKESGFIVTGHGLYETLKANGITSAPVDEQSFKTPADEWAHLLADNRLPQLADLDASALASLEHEISAAGLELDLTGALLEEPTPVSFAEVATQTPPQFTWVLIGLPTVRFGEIAERIEQLAGVKEIFCATTSNDQEPPKNPRSEIGTQKSEK